MSGPAGSTTEWEAITPGATSTPSLLTEIAAAIASAASDAAAAAAADVAATLAADVAASAASAAAAATSASEASGSASGASSSAEASLNYSLDASGYADAASASASAASASASAASTSAGTASSAASAASGYASAASDSADAASASADAAAASAASVDFNNLNATNLTSGTVPDARFPSTLPALSGANLTALNASNLGSGTVPNARVGTLAGNVISPEMKDYEETLNALGNKTGAFNCDYTDGNVASFTLTGSVTVTITNPPTSGKVGRITFIVTGDGSSTVTITNANYLSVGAPVSAIANTKRRIYNCVTLNGGSEWFISYLSET